MTTRLRPQHALLLLPPAAALLWAAAPDSRPPLALLLLLIVPGALLDRALRLAPDAPPPVRLALWPGLGLALSALLYEWATALGLRIASPAPAAIGLALAAAGLWLIWGAATSASPAGPRAAPADWLLLPLCALALGLRLSQIRGLAMPAWVDGPHHAMLIRIIAETGQAPLSLRPYLSVDHLAYHWGYHAASALALAIAGAPVPGALPRAMLLQGQLLGALAVPAYAGLARQLWRRPAAGPAAGVVVAVLSIMPAFYVSWSRYSLLAGLLALPAAVALLGDGELPRGRRAAGAAVALAGLSLVHFVVLVYAAVWALALLAAAPSRRALARMPALGAGAALLAAPWLVHLAGLARAGPGASATYVAGNAAYNAMPAELLWAGDNRQLMAAAALGALWCVAQRRRAAGLVAIWCAAVLLLANPPAVGLPYLSFVTNETVAIALFVPMALLIGGGAAALDSAAARLLRRPRARRAWGALAALALAALAVWGADRTRDIVRPDTVLGTADDLAAIAWAAAETPPAARFVVATTGWLGDVDRGADGGWWLLPLAGRQVSTPPVLYTYADDASVARVKAESGWLRDRARSAPELAAFMRERGYGYLYLTEGVGPLDAAQLLASPLFEDVHREGRVHILRLR